MRVLAILLFLLCPIVSWATISASTVWEIRASATSGNLNGCGFVAGSGTDYTLQDAAQLNNTDFATSGVGVTTLTSATGGLTAAMVGSLVHLTAGTNLQPSWYEITGHTDTNTVTLDRAPDNGGGGVSGATGYVGGACSMGSTLDDDLFKMFAAGHRVWIKDGSYTIGEAIIASGGGTVTNMVEINGYSTSRGDAPTGASRPDFDSAPYQWIVNGGRYAWRHLTITGTSSPVLNVGSYDTFENVQIVNTSGSANRTALNAPTYSSIFNSEFVSTNGIGVTTQSGSSLYGNTFRDSNVCLDVVSYDYITIAFNTFDTCATTALDIGSGAHSHTIANNTFYGAETPAGTGILASGTPDNLKILNNIFYGWTTCINFAASVDSVLADYNVFNNCTTPRTNIDAGLNDSTADPQFTDAPNGDFSVGANMKAIGFPGAFQGGNSTGYLDPGAVQRQEPAAGSGGSYTYVQ